MAAHTRQRVALPGDLVENQIEVGVSRCQINLEANEVMCLTFYNEQTTETAQSRTFNR